MTRPDNAEDRLRQAFEAQAGRVEVSPDALRTIRTRIASRRAHLRKTWTMSLASLATASAATVTAVVIGLNSCAPIDNATIPPGNPSVTADSSVPPTDGPTGPTQGPTTGPPVNLPVYFVMRNDNNRLWLYREFHNLSAGGTAQAQVTAAVNEMLAGRSRDPDYTSPWPSGASVRGVQFDGDVVTVDLTGAATNNVNSEAADMAVQQLVYTATAAADVAGQKTVERLRLLLDGQPVTELWGQVGTSGILTRGRSEAPVWLTQPQQGDTVGRTFTAEIVGEVFEATVQLHVKDANGTVVQEHTLTLNTIPSPRGTGSIELTLAPGTYTLEAFTYSARDGSVQSVDDHAITVS